MNKIKQKLQSLQGPALNIYFTAGFPRLNFTGPIIRSLVENGVDLIEVGMPYSDPMADGPTIQYSSSVALREGMTLDLMFEQVYSIASQTIVNQYNVPILLMGYLNQIMQYGEEKFLQSCNRVGISGLIVPDLPPELYEEQYQSLFAAYGIEIIFLITPQTTEKRIRKIDDLSNSFIYMVSDSSITGQTQKISDAQLAYFQRIQKMNLRNPTLIGFGISDHESYRQAARFSAGAIVGSAFIKKLMDMDNDDQLDRVVKSFVHDIRNG